MYLIVTIPALIFNCVCNYLSLTSIYNYYSLSEYSPRLLMIAILIISSFPTSLLSVLTCVLNFNILQYPVACYSFTMFNWLGILSRFSVFILSIYVLLILFTNLKRAFINKIGYGMIIFIFIILGIFELILLPYYGAEPETRFEIMTRNYNRSCSIKNLQVRQFFATVVLAISIFVLLVSIILLIYYYFFKKINVRNKKHKLFLTLALFSFVGSIAPLRFFLEKVLGISQSKNTKFFISDIMKSASGLYSLIYYLVEVYFREKLTDVDIKFILKIDKTRKIYKDYCAERGYRKLHQMINQWEEINESKDVNKTYDILDKKFLNKKAALKILEKHLDQRAIELVWYDKFYYYYLKLEQLGEIDIDLMVEGKNSKSIK